jgi:hypothetical protein
MTNNSDQKTENELHLKWQYKLLPLMSKMLISLTLFFFIASMVQLFYLHSRIEKTPLIGENWLNNAGANQPVYYLEYNLIERRYHQANTSLMSRIWLQYLGFVTGMILALVGATFILGKLRESETTLAVDTSSLKYSLSTSSPGIIMAVLGSAIMITTILVHNPIDVKDDSVFLKSFVIQPENINSKPELPDTLDTPKMKENVIPRPKINFK